MKGYIRIIYIFIIYYIYWIHYNNEYTCNTNGLYLPLNISITLISTAGGAVKAVVMAERAGPVAGKTPGGDWGPGMLGKVLGKRGQEAFQIKGGRFPVPPRPVRPPAGCSHPSGTDWASDGLWELLSSAAPEPPPAGTRPQASLSIGLASWTLFCGPWKRYQWTDEPTWEGRRGFIPLLSTAPGTGPGRWEVINKHDRMTEINCFLVVRFQLPGMLYVYCLFIFHTVWLFHTFFHSLT